MVFPTTPSRGGIGPDTRCQRVVMSIAGQTLPNHNQNWYPSYPSFIFLRCSRETRIVL